VSTGHDPAQRRAAARLSRRYPHWEILWGTWSRRFWGFPRFDAPPGTIICAPTVAALLSLMRQAELAAEAGLRHPPQPPAGPPPRPASR
jgi:hypothetical protein